jgi:hexosaminidase
MNRAILILLFAAAAHAALMPMPAKLVYGNGALAIGTDFSITNDGCSDSAVARFRSRLTLETGSAPTGGGPGLAIHCAQPAPQWPTLGEDESYTLDVTPAGAQLNAPTGTGALRGMQTFLQLVQPSGAGPVVPAVHIEDKPRYPWRGLMMDVVRHWMPIEIVERNLDAMEAVKLNVLHLHLTDDQGFRVESKLYPQLQTWGSNGNFYTQDQIREIVAYARDRGIRVIPEFDLPGHSVAWFAGMPELAMTPGTYQIAITWGGNTAVMNETSDSTFAFLDAFVGEISALFPDPYWHVGGDEVQGTQALAQQPQFELRLLSILKKYGKSMIGWDEILANGLGSDSVIQSWRGPTGLTAAAAKGYRSVLSYGYYLDHLSPASYHYANDPGDGPGVLGGEACMWAEYVSSQTVDSRIWPRMAAIAERLWSPKDVNDVNSMYARLWDVSRRLELTGVQHDADYVPMLQHIAGGLPLEPLLILGNVSEATGITVRSLAMHYTSLTPLDRFVDAARPESETVYRMELAAQNRSRTDLGLLRARFREWMESAVGYPSELASLSHNLQTVGQIGMQALSYWSSGEPAPAAWVTQANQTLNKIENPTAEVVLAAVRPVQILLAALRLQ